MHVHQRKAVDYWSKRAHSHPAHPHAAGRVVEAFSKTNADLHAAFLPLAGCHTVGHLVALAVDKLLQLRIRGLNADADDHQAAVGILALNLRQVREHLAAWAAPAWCPLLLSRYHHARSQVDGNLPSRCLPHQHMQGLQCNLRCRARSHAYQDAQSSMTVGWPGTGTGVGSPCNHWDLSAPQHAKRVIRMQRCVSLCCRAMRLIVRVSNICQDLRPHQPGEYVGHLRPRRVAMLGAAAGAPPAVHTALWIRGCGRATAQQFKSASRQNPAASRPQSYEFGVECCALPAHNGSEL